MPRVFLWNRSLRSWDYPSDHAEFYSLPFKNLKSKVRIRDFPAKTQSCKVTTSAGRPSDLTTRQQEQRRSEVRDQKSEKSRRGGKIACCRCHTGKIIQLSFLKGGICISWSFDVLNRRA